MTATTATAPERAKATATMELTVAAIAQVGTDIRIFTLAAPDGRALPAFVPGSHLVLAAGDRTNAYSLTCDGTNPHHYVIAVLRVADGLGGSRWLHDTVKVGDVLTVWPPRSAFAPVATARKHLLVAGGIGVTPIVSHLRAARRWGRETQTLYIARHDRAALVDEVRHLTDNDAELFTAREHFSIRLAEVLTEQPIGTHLYVCGPATLIDHVVSAATDAGWPPSRVHFERFGTDPLDDGDPFSVRLTATDTTLDVPSGTTMLEALEAAGIEVANRCRQGVCGECRTPVAAGQPVHRDLYLTDEEKKTGESMMPCVSRAANGDTLEIAL